MSSLWGEKYLDCKQKNKTERIGKYLIGIHSADLTGNKFGGRKLSNAMKAAACCYLINLIIILLYFKNKIKRRPNLHFQAWCQYDDDDRL